MLWKTFRWAFAVTAVGLVGGVLYDGWAALGIVAILAVLEISLSFDNAVINAGILKKLNAFWQRIFLTVGIVIAVFGMRLLFPVVIVSVSARLAPQEAVNLALTDKERYQQLVTDAHPSIAAFGGMFLLMIFLDFILEDRATKWLGRVERPLARLGRIDMLSVCVALVVLLATSTTFATQAHQHGGHHADKAQTVLVSGSPDSSPIWWCTGCRASSRPGWRGSRAARPGAGAPGSRWPAGPPSSPSCTSRCWTRPSPSTA